MRQVFCSDPLLSASCFSFSLASSSLSFLTKYSSSCAFFLSSHLFATVSLLKVHFLKSPAVCPLHHTLCEMFSEPFAGLDQGLGSGLSIDDVLSLRVIEKSMSGPIVHRDFILLFVSIESFAKHLDFRPRGARVIRTIMAQKWSGDALQIFRIRKKALVVNDSRRKRARLGYRIKRQPATHTKAQNRDVFLTHPWQFTKIGNT